MTINKTTLRRCLIWTTATIALLLTTISASAQTPTPEANLQLTGPVTQITENTLIINGLPVSTAGASLEGVNIGDVISLDGSVEPDGTIIIINIIIVDDNNDDGATPTPQPTTAETATVEPTSPPETEAPTTTPANQTTPTKIIVIEGPVQSIDINVVVIYNIEIVIERDDPVLTVIRIGDVIRVRGEVTDDSAEDDDSDTLRIVIIPITIVFINVDVFILDGRIWRDPGDCTNPPPEWVLDNDRGTVWLIRCTGRPSNPGGGHDDDDDDGGGNRGRGDGDDDDDD